MTLTLGLFCKSIIAGKRPQQPAARHCEEFFAGTQNSCRANAEQLPYNGWQRLLCRPLAALALLAPLRAARNDKKITTEQLPYNGW